MNKTLQEGIELAKEVNSKVKAANAKDVKVIIGTPFIHLAEVSKMVDPAIDCRICPKLCNRSFRSIYRRSICSYGGLNRKPVCHSRSL